MKTKLFLLLPSILISSLIFSQSQGPNSPTVANSMPTPNGSIWNTPNNVFISDGNTASALLTAYPSCAGNNCFYSQPLRSAGYGFAIPGTATIVGIVAEVQRRNINNPVTVKDSTVKIMKAGIPVGTNHASFAAWTLTLTYASYGSPTDLWGTTWTPAQINNANFGLYFTVRDTGSGQPGAPQVDHIRITVYYNTLPPVAAFTASQTNFCQNSCINFTDNSTNNPTGWAWTFPGGTPATSTLQNPTNICYNTAGSYTATLTATNGNGSSTTSQTLTVNPLPNILVTGNPSVCDGSSACFAASGALNYIWAGPCGFTSTLPSPCINPVTPCAAGTYTVTGTDINGCTNTGTFTLTVNLLPTVSYIQSPMFACVNWNPLTLTAGTPGGGTYSGTAVIGNTFSPSTSGAGTFTITYTYTDINGCSNSDTSSMIVGLCTGVNENNFLNQISISPNPSSGIFTIEFESSHLEKFTSLEVYNSLGEKVFESVISNHQSVIDLRSKSKGIYFVKVISDEKVYQQKIVIE